MHDLYPDMAYALGYSRQGSLAGKAYDYVAHFVYKRCSKIIVLSNDMYDHFVNKKAIAKNLP
ncbi:hypothetical protein IPL68_07415 [Candidatus Saccharibacteria bacterium]|nr:MAG: hypothetical protein IPL68_07415 [Candidatus Saccharibacteria bacterium]